LYPEEAVVELYFAALQPTALAQSVLGNGLPIISDHVPVSLRVEPFGIKAAVELIECLIGPVLVYINDARVDYLLNLCGSLALQANLSGLIPPINEVGAAVAACVAHRTK